MSIYKNFFCNIYHSFFLKEFYIQALKRKRSHILDIFILIIITYMIPTLLIYNKISKINLDDNTISLSKNINHIISQIPPLTIKNQRLQSPLHDNNPINITDKSSRNIISIDPKSSSPSESNSVILISESGIFFNKVTLINLFINYLGIQTINNLQINNKIIYLPFTSNDMVITQSDIKKYLVESISNIKNFLIVSFLPVIILFSFIAKILQILFFSLITKLISNSKKITLSKNQVILLTIAASIPITIIQMINVAFLWSSKILNTQPLALLIFTFVNLYYINLAVNSQIKSES